MRYVQDIYKEYRNTLKGVTRKESKSCLEKSSQSMKHS